MTITLFIIGLLIGVAFLAFGFRLLVKDKTFAGICFAGVAAFFLFSSLPWVQGFTKTWIISNANAKFTQLGEQIDSVQKITSEMHGQLNDHQTKIDKHQTELDTHQTGIAKAQADVLTQQTNNGIQFKQIAALQGEISTAQTNVMEQAKKIEDVDYLVQNMYSNMVNELIVTTDTNKAVLLRSTNGDSKFAFILRYPPIRGSLQAVLERGSQLGIEKTLNPDSILDGNVFLYTFTGFDTNNMAVRFRYVKDGRNTNFFDRIKPEPNGGVFLYFKRLQD